MASNNSILKNISNIDNKIVRYELAQKIIGDVQDTFFDERINILRLAKKAYIEEHKDLGGVIT